MPSVLEKVTKRERDVAISFYENVAYKLVADDQKICVDTVTKHMARLRAKLGVRTNVELYALLKADQGGWGPSAPPAQRH